MAPAAVAKGVDVELAAGPPLIVEGNPGLLAVLVRNLADNAVRYSARGGAVHVAVVQDAAAVRLVVTDQGPGVPPAAREALGRRFYRVPGSGETGTGLGLSIVKRVAELHDATIEFRDGPDGRGLQVRVAFPRA